MKAIVSIVAVFVIVTQPLFAAPVSGKVSSNGPDGKFEMSVTLAKDASSTNALVCSADVRQTGSSTPIAAPKIIFERGKSAKVETKNGDMKFTLSVSSEAGSNEVNVTGELSKGGRVVFSPKLLLKAE